MKSDDIWGFLFILAMGVGVYILMSGATNV